MFFVFFFQAEDGIRDLYVTGVQTCALPISLLAEQDSKPGRAPSAKRVTAKPAASSGERAASRRAAPSRARTAAKATAKPAAASKTATSSESAGGRTRARQA